MHALERTAEGRQFVADVRDFLEHYGQRAARILVSDPSWIEDPKPVFITCEYAAQPDRDLAGEQRERTQEQERLVADVRHGSRTTRRRWPANSTSISKLPGSFRSTLRT